MQQFCVQNRGAGRAADGVMTHRDEPDAFPDPADGYGHGISAVPVKPGLRAVFLIEIEDGMVRLGRQAGERGLPGFECLDRKSVV